MKITRHNYEEYFILYMDNELDSEDRREVELFVKENPDLQAEMDILVQSQLSVDTNLVFANKASLLKNTGSAISETNYEEWLLSYIDNELTPAQKHEAEQLMAGRPAIKAELEILQKTKIAPEQIVFGDKSSLYRREEKVRVVAINWRRIAIAASLLLAVGTAAVVLFNTHEERPQEIVNTGGKETISTPQKTEVEQKAPVIVTEPAELQMAINEAGPFNKEKEKNSTAANIKAAEKVNTVVEKTVTTPVKEELAVTAEKKKSNELPEPLYNPNVNKAVPQDNPIAMNDARVQEPLTIVKQTSPVSTVTPATSDALYTSNKATDSFDEVDEDQAGKKNKLRGFFRKVTRTFEKNTNIKATDDEDRLLLGGLAIKL